MNIDSEVMKSFLEDYRTYVVNVLIPTRREIKELFLQFREPGYWKYAPEDTQTPGPDRSSTRLPAPSPIQRIHTRIKRGESVVDKILRRPTIFEKGLSPESFHRMADTIGVRIILYFLCHMPLIDRELRKRADVIEISDEHQPVAYLSDDLTRRLALVDLDRKDKESGYASVHYILRLKESEVPIESRPWFELQVRTLTEDTWGEIEHVLGYKPGKRTSFAVRRQFQIISKLLAAIDEHFNFLHDELSRFQVEVEYEESDPLNPENLPNELLAIGLGCSQREIDGLLKLLVSRKVETVGKMRSLSTPKRLDIIRNTFWAEEGRPPNNFEVVANLANLVGSDQETEQVARIKEQIGFLKAWEDLKKKGLV